MHPVYRSTLHQRCHALEKLSQTDDFSLDVLLLLHQLPSPSSWVAHFDLVKAKSTSIAGAGWTRSCRPLCGNVNRRSKDSSFVCEFKKATPVHASTALNAVNHESSARHCRERRDCLLILSYSICSLLPERSVHDVKKSALDIETHKRKAFIQKIHTCRRSRHVYSSSSSEPMSTSLPSSSSSSSSDPS
jgi:hypothetical protein